MGSQNFGEEKMGRMHKKLKVGKTFLELKKKYVKTNLKKKNIPHNESSLKLPELPRNHVSGGGEERNLFHCFAS